jgi:predicted sulfurtransferase
MSKTRTLIIIPLLLLFILACNALIPLPDSNDQSPAENNVPLTEAEVPRVSAQDAKAAFEGGEAIIVDVRSQASFEQSHVEGALSIPLSTFEVSIENVDLPKDQWIITYCT